MFLDLGPRSQNTNASGGSKSCEKTYPDDGRVTYDDPAYHKGDWGRHRREKQLEDGNKDKSGEYGTH